MNYPSAGARPAPVSASNVTERAGRWFLDSSIQAPTGSVARYHRTDTNKNCQVSTEITGYAAATLAYLHELTGDPRYLDAALRAGRFLTRTAWDPVLETLPFEYAADGVTPSALAYFFDCGIIVRGLLSLWRSTKDTEFLETAQACGHSMAHDFVKDREFHPVLSLPTKAPAPRDRRWSRNPGCYQLKSAMALHELYEETGKEEHLQAYEAVLVHSLRTHSAFLTIEPEQERLMDRLHAYCYFLEGILPCVRQPDCAAVLAEGILLVEGHLREIASVFERSDVYGQLLRLRLFAAHLGVAPPDLSAAEQEASKILEFQLDHPDSRNDGGFCFGRKGSELLPFVNPASTAFCLQAIQMWREYRAGTFHADRLKLI